LKQAPFNKRDAQLLPATGSCVDCPKRTGNNKLLFAEWSENESQCTDPNCYAAKVEAHVQKQVAAKPELVQISTAYGQQQEGSKIVTRSKYVEIRSEKPDSPEKAKWPEFKTCRFTAEAIVADGLDKGEVRKVCTQPDCPVHHPKKQPSKADASFKVEQDKRRREEALANATGLRVLQTIVASVPVRLMKRDLLFIAEQMLPLLDEKSLEIRASGRRKANPQPSC
jgi:ParB family chromosome partitioning protein